MVWWLSGGKKEEAEKAEDGGPKSDAKQGQLTNYSRGQRILLEDTKPRFNGETSQSQLAVSQEEANFRRAWNSISKEDFSFGKLTAIPCFRDAGLVGFTCMFVTGAVTFLYHKNPTRAANWSVGGLLLGSVVGWEQCRLRRKRSFQVAQMARQTVAAKPKPMLNAVAHDEKTKHQWDGHTQQEQQGKSWYKFW
ncbi:hypothetical protein HG536_0H01880 [Torulaspora globosa]|uniref:Cytochrome c oxidase assembly protein COX20, mitochondrial n=1 Tax=Torulaspora globosa TaxID=48254 RepID=A0A7G3ZMS7_9SACH|nr:uncharacterized protein HG536_0H01880 [Torulaspora globosa]QLL34813.1 hypothetical protein HG536_0H01880 [Torulaspora globosa]